LQESELSKVDILLNDQPVPELSFISHTTVARAKGKEVVGKLKENLPRQQFSIKIQANYNNIKDLTICKIIYDFI